MTSMINARCAVAFTVLLPLCAAAEDDSVLYVSHEESDQYWIATHKAAPVYPQRAMQRGDEGCVTVGYIIESDGTTSAHSVVAVWPSKLFNWAALEAAKQFSYGPAAGNVDREPIYTTNAFTFQMGGLSEEQEQERAALAMRCDDAAHKSLAGVAGP